MVGWQGPPGIAIAVYAISLARPDNPWILVKQTQGQTNLPAYREDKGRGG
jgi:hypothetical protein